MSGYIILYFLVSILFIRIWYKVYQKYKTKSGIYFLISSIFTGARLLFYIFSFAYLWEWSLYISRFMFFLSMVWMYSMWFFYLFFNNYKKQKKYINPLVILFYIIVLGITIATDLVVVRLEYNPETFTNLDIYGQGYDYFFLLYYIFMVWFLYTGIKFINKQSQIQKQRLKYLFWWFVIFIYGSQIFELLLPYFGTNILHKEIVLFALPFICLSWYSITRYYYVDIFVELGSFFKKIFLLIVSIISLFLIKNIFSIMGGYFNDFWWNYKDFVFLDIGIILFLYFTYNKIIPEKYFYNKQYGNLNIKLRKIENEISHINNIEEVNIYLYSQVQKKLWITYLKIKLISNADQELCKYFQNKTYNKTFLNDSVFIEENKHRFNKTQIKKELIGFWYIIFPIYNSWGELVALLDVWKKFLNEPYYHNNIVQLSEFTLFLSRHIKHISMYQDINDLNVNLDKKVDEKTIKYNSLINKQKEFISVVSHELKWPIGASIFHLDCLIDDLKTKDISQKQMTQELDLLNQNLIKSAELSTKLFSVEMYELDSIKLFKEETNIAEFIEKELQSFQKRHKNLVLTTQIEENLNKIEIDQVQMRQVIDNLLNNSMKFIENTNAEIIFRIFKKNKVLYFEIEDNWIWFKGIDISHIFDKYQTGSWNSIGIGMWLYLCKKIIEMHDGSIDAQNSTQLWGAKFLFTLPK